jgi:hypothetical protein
LVAELGRELVAEAEELVDDAWLEELAEELLVEDAAEEEEEEEEEAEAVTPETSWACWTPDALLIVPKVLFM